MDCSLWACWPTGEARDAFHRVTDGSVDALGVTATDPGPSSLLNMLS
jgi:hypothetical protein